MRRSPAAAVPVALAALGLAVAWAVGRATPPEPVLVVRDEAGSVLATVALPESRFALRYRNSVYGSLAEERFEVDGTGFRLVELAVDERAVLDEYYETVGPARPAGGADARAWVGLPARPLWLAELSLAATDLGARTVLAAGSQPLELWRLVPDDQPTVILSLEPAAP